MTARFSHVPSSSGQGIFSVLGGVGVEDSLRGRGRSCRPGHYGRGRGSKFCGASAPSFPALSSSSGCFGSGFGVPAGGFHPSLASRRHSKGIFHSHSSQLFETVYCPEGCYGPTSYIGPLGFESSIKETSFQDGGPQEGRPFSFPWSLGCEARPQGRIFPSASGSPGDQILRFCSGEKGVRLSGSPLWPVFSSVAVHPGSQASKEGFEENGCSDFVLSGRFPDSGSLASRGVGSLSPCYRSPSASRLPDQLEEVGAGSPEVSGVFGGHGRFGVSDLLPPSGEGRQSLVAGDVRSTPLSHEEGVGISGRVPQFCGGLRPSGEVVAETGSVLGQQSLLPAPQAGGGGHGWPASGSSSSLGLPCLPGDAGAIPGSGSFSGSHDGCFPPWLGGRFGWSPGRRGLGCSFKGAFHQLAGTEGHSSFSASFSSRSGGEMYLAKIGQYDRSCVHSEAGIIGLSGPLVSFQGSPLSGSSIEYPFGSSSSEGSPQRPCGQGLPFHSDKHRVVSRRDFFRESLSSSRDPSGGLDGHVREHPSFEVRVSLPRLSGGVLRCLLSRLGSVDINLSVSPISASAGGDSQVGFLPGQGVSSSTFLALSHLVSPVGGEVSIQNSPGRGRRSFPANFAGPSRVVGDSSLPASRLDLMKATLVAEGFSDLAAEITLDCHKQSTKRQYQSVWSKFLKYLVSEKLHPHALKLCHIHNFLALESEVNNKAYKTIAAYKCALSLPLKLCFNLDLDGVRTTSFMRGAWNRNPPKPRPMPSWDLSDLLCFLRSDRFEDLRTVPFFLLTQKVLALLLIASGRRISEIANLSLVTYVRKSRTCIEWLPGFRAKWCSGFSGFTPQSPSVLRMKSSSSRDLRNCPVRALCIFLERRAAVTGRNGDLCLWTLSQASLAASFRSLIKASRRHVGLSVDIDMYPHQAKRFAVSYCWKHFEGVESALPARVGNSSVRVLKRSYLGPVPDLRLPCVVPLGTIP